MRYFEQMAPALYARGDIREVVENGKSWFVAADVCAALGLANPTQVVRRLDASDWKRLPLPTAGGTQSLLVVSEPAVYELTFSSRTIEAKAARRPIENLLTRHVSPLELILGIGKLRDSTPEQNEVP